MTFLATLLLIQTPVIVNPAQFLTYSRSVVSSGVSSKVEQLFQNKEDSAYLFEMASRQGGLRAVKVDIIPAPPGWEDTAPYWAVFHTQQEIEQDHDPVYGLLRTNDGLKLGRELPEWAGIETRIAKMATAAQLSPSEHKISVRSVVELDGKATSRAPIFRLNDVYSLSAVKMGGATSKVIDAGGGVPSPSAGDVVRAGGLLIPWTSKPNSKLEFTYSGVVNTSTQDKINEKQAYVTAWWVPSIGRLPHPSIVRISGPADWVLKAEGKEIDSSSDGLGPIDTQPGQQTKSFQCDLPISYPKVIGGRYRLVAESTVNGKNFRSYQLEPVEKDRGQKEVDQMVAAMKFYEDNLGPFPFDHYWCFDATGYYGIESYSHTLLQKGYTLRFVSHEMGHTYFGGIVPCAYTRDTWNEGLTQYIDSVAFQNNNDRTLENGLRTVNLKTPLIDMDVAYANNSATYWRGAYVMKMLEYEIGKGKMMEALRAMIKDRLGKETTWTDLRPYFEKSSGQKLDWFWNQWVSNANFPSLQVLSGDQAKIERNWRTRVTVKQSGTPSPFRLRFIVRVRRGPLSAEKVVEMHSPQATFSIDTDFEPTSQEVDSFPYTLSSVTK
ncbi:MAG: hypothetical protein BGO01_02865 [Armatimonadetes bacterium 55-13]|nr:MAG: hypothetical protein BGO01_02865 [Armatimonadetes bacterium 55-13]